MFTLPFAQEQKVEGDKESKKTYPQFTNISSFPIPSTPLALKPFNLRPAAILQTPTMKTKEKEMAATTAQVSVADSNVNLFKIPLETTLKKTKTKKMRKTAPLHTLPVRSFNMMAKKEFAAQTSNLCNINPLAIEELKIKTDKGVDVILKHIRKIAKHANRQTVTRDDFRLFLKIVKIGTQINTNCFNDIPVPPRIEKVKRGKKEEGEAKAKQDVVQGETTTETTKGKKDKRTSDPFGRKRLKKFLNAKKINRTSSQIFPMVNVVINAIVKQYISESVKNMHAE